MIHVVLPYGATPLAGPVVFPGVPGRYFPGLPVPLDEIGLSEDEARAVIGPHPVLELTDDTDRMTVADTLAQVGDDLDAIDDALLAERTHEVPRQTLIRELEKRRDRLADDESEE